MEIFKYYCKDINIVEVFEQFKKCHPKVDHKDTSKTGYSDQALRFMFLQALMQPKYCVFISATKQNTFLLKKTFMENPIITTYCENLN